MNSVKYDQIYTCILTIHKKVCLLLSEYKIIYGHDGGAMGWSVVCDCGISCSYSLAFFFLNHLVKKTCGSLQLLLYNYYGTSYMPIYLSQYFTLLAPEPNTIRQEKHWGQQNSPRSGCS